MSRKHDEPTVSRHLEIYQADWEFLQEHFGLQSDTKLGVSTAIRQMVRRGVSDYKARVAARLERVAQAQQRMPAAAGPLPSLDKFFAPLTPETSPDGK